MLSQFQTRHRCATPAHINIGASLRAPNRNTNTHTFYKRNNTHTSKLNNTTLTKTVFRPMEWHDFMTNAIKCYD